MNIGIVGMGLIGGSFAHAVKEKTEHTVFAYDIVESAFLAAQMFGLAKDALNAETLPRCDLVLLAVPPSSAVEYMQENAARVKKGGVVVDCCGVKRTVQNKIAPIAAQNGFCFVGGHPMAGTQNSGLKNARSSLFKGASMLLSPGETADIQVLDNLKAFFLSLGFGEVVFVSGEVHDRRIAYTSQLAHVVSNAYIKSPTAAEHKGFSAGSYKDLTRVARLNEQLWTELFLDNADNLSAEIRLLIQNLTAYADAIEAQDENTLCALLKDGRERKEHIESEAVRR
jgi:prephenate dehydrogenase